MGSTHDRKALKLWTGATYRIRVQGRLDKRYSDQLGGLTITLAKDDDHAPVTTLYGRLLDQAALLGVLNTLYNSLHLPLLLVDCVDIGAGGGECERGIRETNDGTSNRNSTGHRGQS